MQTGRIRQLTRAAHGHILTNINVWSPDSRWIVYDTRSDPAGSVFDGSRIERVNVDTGEVQLLYESRDGAHCGVATVCPFSGRVAFILGPENPTAEYQYGPSRRRGVIVDPDQPGIAFPLDARDLVPPFTPGALRGGTHVHVFSPDGQFVSFTYDDDIVSSPGQRYVGITDLSRLVRVPATHPRSHSGFHSVLVTRTTAQPQPGTDEISRACEEGWVGQTGYSSPDSTIGRAIAFQGTVVTQAGEHVEVFIVDLPEDLTAPGFGPIEGTASRLPLPPLGVKQRRLTFTADRRFPGIQGPRHWLRSSPDGSRIGFLMRDDSGIVQLWTVVPWGGPPVQVTATTQEITTCFSWSPDGKHTAYGTKAGLWIVNAHTGESIDVGAATPRPEACVFSPDGRRIAFIQSVHGNNQIFVAELPARLRD